jgi:hypothetical protein
VTKTKVAVSPPKPDASNIKNAASSGDPNNVAIAAKLPVAATTAAVLFGVSRLISFIAM